MSEKTSSTVFMNPMIRKLSRVEERDEVNAATYGGIAGKTCFFMLWAVGGIAAFYLLRGLMEVGPTYVYEGYTIYLWEASVAVGALIISGFAPLLAFLIKPLVPVLGSLYCLTFAYTITWVGNVFAAEMAPLIAAAVIITVLLVMLMAILYATRIVKVNHKFRAVITILFFTMVFSGILAFIGSFIPGIAPIIAELRENAVFSVVTAVIYVVIACLFLLVDFNTIENTVQNRLPKKYEWIAAFGLAYTIFYLFLKVFHLLLAAKGNQKN